MLTVKKATVEYQSQWEFRPLGKGWTIKNVFGESYYLTTEPSSYGRFVSVVVHNFPITWDVQIEHEDPGLFRWVSCFLTIIQKLSRVHAQYLLAKL